MIFATTGTQLGFPRLMAALNALAPDLDEEIVAQAGPDQTPYPALRIVATLSPAEYENIVTRARLIVAHAGIGTILTAKRHGKPLVLLPRRHALGEHRNDHQLATARQVAGLTGVHVIWEVEALAPLLACHDLTPASDTEASESRAALTGFLRDWVATGA